MDIECRMLTLEGKRQKTLDPATMNSSMLLRLEQTVEACHILPRKNKVLTKNVEIKDISQVPQTKV
jgi:hypothetical protein